MKPKTKNKIKKKNLQLTRGILTLLAKSPEALFDIFIRSDPYYKVIFFGKETTRRQLGRAARDLEKRRLISKRTNRQAIIYEITDLGRAKNLKWNYKRKPKKQRQDGFSTIIIFDIPEQKKKSRDFLRRFLKDNDFVQLQESVYIGRFWLIKDFYELLEELRIKEYVSVLEGRILVSV
ncbi:MAG: hypothetical protein Q8P83_03185 [bacterium]|nr:hypothetical protein [bacterium]